MSTSECAEEEVVRQFLDRMDKEEEMKHIARRTSYDVRDIMEPWRIWRG